MAHYFDTDPDLVSKPFEISFNIENRDFHLTSDEGVFSKSKLDTGTQILLDTVLEHQSPLKTLLDLGAGIGVIGTVLSAFWNCEVLGVEINQRSADLCALNYEKNHVNGKVLCQDGTEKLDEKFDGVLINPPIRAGKQVVYGMFDTALDALNEKGVLWIVMRKQHGAASAMKYLDEKGFETELINRDKGFWVMKAEKGQEKSV